MKLADYIEAQGLTYAEFGKRIGVKGKDTVAKYARGERTPQGDLMHRIAEATGGKVTANDFFGIAL